MTTEDIVIVAAARTPQGRLKGQLSSFTAPQLGSLAIAGALAMRPRLLILDEPTSDLDPAGRREVLETLSGLEGQGITVLLIEHNLEEVAQYADRCLVMEKGQIVQDGESASLARQPEQLTRYLGV